VSTAELRSWHRQPDLMKFPYAAVLREFHGVGKHFVSRELLDLLVSARSMLPTMRGPWPRVHTLVSFLDSALDKLENRYDYSTYLALSLLRLPGPDDPIEQAPFARSRCDRLTVALLADALAFELSAVDGRTALLPKMRPPVDLVTKRCKHGMRAIRPALARMSLDVGLASDDAADLARQACAAVQADMSFAEARAMDLSMLPVDTVHDEYLFLRILQTFETTFALLVVQLRGVIRALLDKEVDRATHFLRSSEAALRESAPLFSMLATMQVESFRTFRQFTDGASAIQSDNYKLVESLCRSPEPSRVGSSAYHSVPEVRIRVLAGQYTLDDAYHDACEAGDFAPEDLTLLGEAMKAFAQALLRWRQTHYRLAVRMLGSTPGTGYTEGTPYLDAARNIPVFDNVEVDNDSAKTP